MDHEKRKVKCLMFMVLGIFHVSLVGDSITIPKGKSVVVISGYKVEGKLEITVNSGKAKWANNP